VLQQHVSVCVFECLHAVLSVVSCRVVVPEGYVAMPSTADGGAAPSPHRLALHVYRRPGREAVLQVRWGDSVCLRLFTPPYLLHTLTG
jgi:hypothetical protein